MEACRTNPFARWFAPLAFLVCLNAAAMEITSPAASAYRQAINANDPETVRRLIREGLPAQPAPGERWSPLEDAAFFGRVEIVRVMLDEGVSPNSRHAVPGRRLKDDSASTSPARDIPILYQVLDWLYRAGPRQSKQPERTRHNPDDWRRIAELLIERGADPNAIFEYGTGGKFSGTPLSLAAEYNDLDMAKRLIAKGADTNLPHESSFAPLFFAAKNGNVEMAKLLLEGGADMNALDEPSESSRHTPISTAANHSSEVASMFLDRGANPDDSNLMFCAILDKRHTLLKKLTKKNVDVNTLYNSKASRSEHSYTPLSYAAHVNDPIAIEILLNAGADPCKRDKEGNRPYDVARRFKYGDALNLLEKRSPEQRCNTPR